MLDPPEILDLPEIQTDQGDDDSDRTIRAPNKKRQGVLGFIDRFWGRIWIAGVFAPFGTFVNAMCYVIIQSRYPKLAGQHFDALTAVSAIGLFTVGTTAAIVAVSLNRELSVMEKVLYLFGSFWLSVIISVVCVMLTFATAEFAGIKIPT